MLTDKEAKKIFKEKASREPDKYYATSVLKQEGFSRKKCIHCGKFFWTINPKQETCDDPACSGGFRFIGNTPVKESMSYIETWKKFSSLFKKLGYTPIKRYPVVARWRPDVYWVGASIYDFQPYVVSGEVEPPANPLVVPQVCLRFNDIDNVGITGAHYTGFVMVGQHAFQPPEKYDQEQYFRDIHSWLKKGLGIKNNEITFHEDAWAGGGNFGPCMEFFSRGLELGNQVYMLFEQTPSSYRELNIKVLDMGMGLERNAWFSNGTSTSYETTFPTAAKKLYNIAGIKIDSGLMRKFLPYSSYLNVDEVDNIDKAWLYVASKINIDVKELKQKIIPLSALYSIAEHSRSLLFALSDGALPSNIGGGYNLRVILRRALSFIDKYGWDISLTDICNEHASYLKPLFPELSENLDIIAKIIDVEKQKYNATKQKSRQIIGKLIKEKISKDRLLQLYDSHGIDPEIIKQEALKLGKAVEVPKNFYAEVSELHSREKKETFEEKEKLDLNDLNETKALYYDDYKKERFSAKVLKIIKNNVVLDQTIFYPSSGGQDHDTGSINNQKVVDVFKQGNIIVHVLDDKPRFKERDEVEGVIDLNKRLQLTQHHTATHIINAAARKVLGQHINQAGAKKTIDKAHLDVTHYQSITNEELEKIEKLANKIINDKIPIYLNFMPRNDAEKKYGMNIYQGGAVPGKNIRIVEIKNIDAQACGGTHLKNTSEVGKIRILRAVKIQDGVVRIEFVAGERAKEEIDKKKITLNELSKILNVDEAQIPVRVEELFTKWKKARKALKKAKQIPKQELELKSKEKFQGDILTKTAEILKTQPEHLVKTVKRFMDELESFKKK